MQFFRICGTHKISPFPPPHLPINFPTITLYNRSTPSHSIHLPQKSSTFPKFSSLFSPSSFSNSPPFSLHFPPTFPQLSTTQIHSPPPNHPDPSPTSPHLYFSLFPFSLTNWVLWYLQKAKRLLVVREPSEVERGDCQKFKPVRHKFTTPKVLWTIGYALWYELV